MFKPIAVIAGLDDMTMVRESVQQRGRHLGISKNAWPLRKIKIGGDYHEAGALIKFAYEMKQQRPTSSTKREIAELVDSCEVPGYLELT